MIHAGIVLTINLIGGWDVIISHALYTEHERASERKPWTPFLDLQYSSTAQKRMPREGCVWHTLKCVWHTLKDLFALTHPPWCHCFQPTHFKQSCIRPLFYRCMNYISDELSNRNGFEWCRDRFQLTNLCTTVIPSGSFTNEQENRAGTQTYSIWKGNTFA